MTTMENKRSTYQQRYEAADDGLRFQDLTYTGNFVGLEPVTDGIKGDKMMRSRAKSGVLERVSKDDVLRDQFTIDELNDLNNYLAWNIWDVLVMRATEGVSGMIPRQEYEILAFMHEFYRWPEILRMTTDEAGGPQGVMDIGASARREIGTKVNAVHDWCIGAVGFGMGRCGLLALEVIGPDDYIEESNEILKFMQRILWGKRQDGYILNSQDRYRCRIHEPDFLATLTAQVEPLEAGSPKHGAFTQFNAAAELLSFLDHYDCRLGLGDTGPYELPDGNLLILRDLFVNEEVFHWSDVARTPACRTPTRWPSSSIRRRWRWPRSGSTTSRPPSPGPRTTSTRSSGARCSPGRSGTPRWARSTTSPSTSWTTTWSGCGRRPSSSTARPPGCAGGT
jgi:hypothetical protein